MSRDLLTPALLEAHDKLMINHFPIAPFTTIQEGNTTLLIAHCSCDDPDCVLSAAIMPENFFTPDGEAATRQEVTR